MKVVIIGGGLAGVSVALNLRKLDKKPDITILEKTNNLVYSKCALPYLKQIKKGITLFTKKDFEEKDIDLELNSHVVSIDMKSHKVSYSQDNKNKIIEYDKLVLATGSSPCVPPIKGIENTEYSCFRTAEDAKILDTKAKNIVIIGAGYVGVELASALSKQSKVTIIEAMPSILPNTLDKDMSQIVQEYLKKQGITILTNHKIAEIKDNKIDNKIPFDLLILAAGVTPDLSLAKNLKCEKGIVVNEYLQTSDKDIYACGDCVQCRDFFDKPVMSQLATSGIKQAKVVAENLSGDKTKLPPVLNTSITKIGDLICASTGALESYAKTHTETVSAVSKGLSKPGFIPGAKEITVKIIADKKARVIGCQIIGHEEVIGRINLAALAIQNNVSLKELVNSETAFNPCVSPIFDPITVAAEICLKKWKVKHG